MHWSPCVHRFAIEPNVIPVDLKDLFYDIFCYGLYSLIHIWKVNSLFTYKDSQSEEETRPSMNDLVYKNDDAVAVNEKGRCVVYKQYNLSHQGILVPGLSLVQHLSDVNVRL